MFDFLGTQHGAITAGIVCFTVVILAFRITGKHGGGLEFENGKIKVGTGKIEAVKDQQTPLIRFDDWKRFSEELYEYCITLMKPPKEEWYAILHCYENSISGAKKAYVERFLHFNHLPAVNSVKYAEYVESHTNALVKSVCRDMKFITNEFDKEIPDFEATALKKSLSEIIERYRERKTV